MAPLVGLERDCPPVRSNTGTAPVIADAALLHLEWRYGSAQSCNVEQDVVGVTDVVVVPLLHLDILDPSERETGQEK